MRAVFAINIDKVFLLNESMQKILIDKIDTVFLRDTGFSNVNNLFATRYLRNIHSSESTAPFLILTDKDGKIALSAPV